MPPVQRYPPQPQAARLRGSMSRLPSSSNAGKSSLLPNVEVEDFGPPAWRTPLNSRADLGYPDFYPSRPGYNQPEDVLTEENVKNGFIAKPYVAPTAESFSMHGPIHQHLLNGGVERLNQLGEDIIAKREAMMPTFGERAFRIPVRVTYNDTKRHQFLSDLSNPLVPLHRLMRNPVPHGFKGVELLDSMFSPITTPNNRPAQSGQGPKPPADPIPVDRAIWFIRVLGANEISAHRGRVQPSTQANSASVPSPIPATPSSNNTVAVPPPAAAMSSNAWYTQEFTNIFTSWMRLQLVQMALPTINKGLAKPGAPPPKAPVGILGDEKARARWLAKWDYTIVLLRELHAKYLISSRLLTTWLADHLLTSNLAQVGFIVQLISSYIPDMARHVVNGRMCVRAACEKLKEIRSFPFRESLKKIDTALCGLINCLVEKQPEILLSPATWRSHSTTIRDILHDTDLPLEDYERRNTALLFVPSFSNDTSSPRRLQMQEIQKLDSMSSDTNMSELCKSFFDGSAAPTSAKLDQDKFQEKVYILLAWAMSLFTLGVHRPYAICTLLKLWHDERTAHLAKGNHTIDIDVFPPIYNWLDTSAPARNPSNVLAIGITLGELTRSGLFSYGRYIRTLIAQGKTARCSQTGKSHHLGILRALPIFVEGKDLMYQRRMALSGDDWELCERDEKEETAQMEAFKEEVQEYVPEIFGYKRYLRSVMLRAKIDHHLTTAPLLNRYMFLQARFWLFPRCADHLTAKGQTPAMDASTFCRLLQVFRQCYGLSTTADLMLAAIRQATDPEVVRLAMDTVSREADCWTANDRWSRIVDVLMERLHMLDVGDDLYKPVIALLSDLEGKGRLSKVEKKELKVAKEKIEVLPAETSNGFADASISMPAVEQAIKVRDPEQAAALSQKLFKRHGPYSTWGDLWWVTVMKAIAFDQTLKEPTALINTVLAHVAAVESKDNTLDQTVARWLDGLTPIAKVDLLGHRHSPFVAIFLHLVTQRRLSSFTLLEKLAFPIWQLVASTCLTSRARQSTRSQAAAENAVLLAHQILITTGPHTHLPPANLEEVFVLKSSRAKALYDTNVPSLVRHLPYLVVLQYSPSILTHTHEHIRTLLDSLAGTAEFKTAAFRHLHLLKDAFLSSEWSKPSLDPGLETGMVDTLKLIMSETPASDHKSTPPLLPIDSASRFSAWRWTGIVLGLRVEFKTLAGRIETNDRPAEARETLALLVRQSLERDTSPDDADLLCEAFRGIEPVVIQEIISSGLIRLSNLLGQMLSAESQQQLEATDKMMDLVLRIITSSTGAPESIDLGNAPTAARHRLLDVISLALQSVERQLASDEEVHVLGDLEPPQSGSLLRIVLKLLKFTLGLGRSEVNMLTTPRADFGKLAMSFLRVISVLPVGVTVQGLADLLAFVVDSAPPQTRPALYTAFLGEISSAAIQTAFDRYPGLISSLPQTSPVRRPISLQTADATETTSLDDRPWEMFEQLVPAAKTLKHVDMFLSSRPIRDTASIPITLFKPQLKRDPLPHAHVAQRDNDWETSVAERNLGDGLAGEPLGLKQAATLLFAQPKSDPSTESSEDETTSVAHTHTRTRTETSKKSSPITAMTPLTTITPANRPRRSSTRAGTSTKDAIALDDSSSDSDLEIVAEPPPKRARMGSKSTATTASERPTTSGKAPAKRTTGGKGVPRKGTGGKNVGRKAPAGKAPKKR